MKEELRSALIKLGEVYAIPHRDIVGIIIIIGTIMMPKLFVVN